MQTFTNLPTPLSHAVSKTLSDVNTRVVLAHAQSLHDRYMTPSPDHKSPILRGPNDMLAYLSLRFPATYAQIYAALSQIKERIPDWQPKSVLDLGAGPATGIFAAYGVWPTITSSTAVDQEQYFLSLGSHLFHDSKTPVNVNWQKKRIDQWIQESPGSYDLIIVANVLNELPTGLKHEFLEKLSHIKNAVIVLLEPGTRHGYEIIQSATKKIIPTAPLIAPYIENNFIESQKYWILFSQRFIRPEFLRLVRQSMRDSDLMASDWEETKYSYVAFGDISVTHQPYAVCIGPVERYHGYLQLPALTKNGVEKIKVMKRHKELYSFAKNIKWGETIADPKQLLANRDIHY